MPIDIHVPQWGMGIKECKIVAWRKQVGDTVEEGESIAELETAKATQDLESPGTGVLARILVPEGEIVPVREIIAVIEESGEGAS
jgi:pyruvate dehydrogenase E2 component (dihydrolipoamide acetyltransferase)